RRGPDARRERAASGERLFHRFFEEEREAPAERGSRGSDDHGQRAPRLGARELCGNVQRIEEDGGSLERHRRGFGQRPAHAGNLADPAVISQFSTERGAPVGAGAPLTAGGAGNKIGGLPLQSTGGRSNESLTATDPGGDSAAER